VLNQSDADFNEQLKNLSKELRAKVLFECIGGDFTPQVMECMPAKTLCLFYGSLRPEPLTGFDPLLVIGRDNKIQGFFLSEWLKSKGVLRVLPIIRRVTALMNDSTLHSDV
jgi:NADPH:quinone reductase-like Zn-dependent oxidoreductase